MTEAANLVFAGTYVASGSGRVVVLATGGNTRLASISRLTGEVHRRPTPLRLDMDLAVRIIAAVWALSGGRIPLVITVMQVLALDIGTDLLPALALGAERPQAGTMTLPPRPRTAHLLDRGVLGQAFGFLGPIEAAISLAVLPIGAALFFGWRPWDHLPHGGVPLETVSTMVFASIVLMQMANAFECRSTQSLLLHIGPFTNRLLDGAVAVEFVMLLAFVYVPRVRRRDRARAA